MVHWRSRQVLVVAGAVASPQDILQVGQLAYASAGIERGRPAAVSGTALLRRGLQLRAELATCVSVAIAYQVLQLPAAWICRGRQPAHLLASTSIGIDRGRAMSKHDKRWQTCLNPNPRSRGKCALTRAMLRYVAFYCIESHCFSP